MKSKVTKGLLFLYVMSLLIACNTKNAEPAKWWLIKNR